jgi:5-methylcytosine-specific restriction enzyme A
MPSSPLRYCLQHGCGQTVPRGYCHAHQPVRDKGVHYGRRWGKARARYLADHPFCVDCEKLNMITLATDVDHIEPHRGNSERFWDEHNWQALCHSHHSAKTATEGGFVGS